MEYAPYIRLVEGRFQVLADADTAHCAADQNLFKQQVEICMAASHTHAQFWSTCVQTPSMPPEDALPAHG